MDHFKAKTNVPDTLAFRNLCKSKEAPSKSGLSVTFNFHEGWLDVLFASCPAYSFKKLIPWLTGRVLFFWITEFDGTLETVFCFTGHWRFLRKILSFKRLQRRSCVSWVNKKATKQIMQAPIWVVLHLQGCWFYKISRNSKQTLEITPKTRAHSDSLFIPHPHRYS